MDYGKIKPYIEKKLISEQVHPEDENVRIFNYTPACQFGGEWDDVTRQCRGLIMNVATGEVLARPFPKFFNHGEHIQNGWPIPNETPVITEKLDGSLGIMYTLNNKDWIATRGSFMSDQAQWATNWIRNGSSLGPYYDPAYTHLFEIIYPENRIVVNYDFSGLVHLASIETATGKQIPASNVWIKDKRIRVAKQIPTTDLEVLMKMDEPNSEGFVIFYPEENVRMKIKFPEYVRLHKILTGVSEIGIWEILRDGGDFSPLLEKVPDEFFKWVGETKMRLTQEFNKINGDALNQMADIHQKMLQESKLDIATHRAAWANEIKKMTNPAIGFSILDDKNQAKIIWKMIRPHGQHIFKTDLDN